ncbi:RICIN domain-containing protein, partial [Streptomyces canus]|uniref:RICIN domain-containing protein n=1 Tax=Streptomyces canus TaxID=58343 RepID=UPI00368B5A8E
NKSGGRAAAIWTGNATAGQRIGQWVDNSSSGSWNLVKTTDGYYRLQAVKNTALYLTGASAGAPLTLQNAADDGSQEWKLVRQVTG